MDENALPKNIDPKQLASGVDAGATTPSQPTLEPVLEKGVEAESKNLGSVPLGLAQPTPVQKPLYPPITPLPPLHSTPAPQGPKTPEDLAKTISEKLHIQAVSLGMEKQVQGGSPLHKKAAEKDTSLQQSRTFRGDVEYAVHTKNIGPIDIAAAEERKRSEKPRRKEKSAPIISFALGMGITLFFLGGLGIVGYVYITQQREPTTSIKTAMPSLVFAEKTTNQIISKVDRNTVLRALLAFRDSVNPPLGSLEQIRLLPNGEKGAALTSSAFLEALEAKVDSSFVRSLKPEMMIGVHSFDEVNPFIVFKTISYEQAFAGMLKWENNIADELSPFLSRKTITRAETFKDVVIKNKDARVLRNTEGEIAYLYAFPDRETLIITTSEQTLIELVRRLSNTKIINN